MTCLYADARILCDRRAELAGYCQEHARNGSDEAQTLARYAAAMDQVVAHAFGAIALGLPAPVEPPRELFETCPHGTAIDVECYQCEPILDPDFDPLEGMVPIL